MSESEATFDLERDREVGSLDLASAYLRVRGWGVSARYLLAAGPLIAACWVWIDIVSAEDRLGLAVASVFVAGALLWRWAGLVWVQARVMRELGLGVDITWRKVAVAVSARAAAHVAIGWGGVVILPALLGFYFSSFITPMLLNPEQGGGAAIKATLRIVWRNIGRLWLHAAVKTVLFAIGFVSLILVQAILLWTVLPSLLGIDTTDLQLSASGPAWWLSLLFVAWLVFDLFWAVASVLELDRLRARQTGSDLQARIAQLRGNRP